jgi:hypothetical protein
VKFVPCAPFCSPPGVNTLNCLEEWRGKQRISPPGDNITPPQGTKFTPVGQLCPWGSSLPLVAKLRMGLCRFCIGLWREAVYLFLWTATSPDGAGRLGRHEGRSVLSCNTGVDCM